MSALKKHTFTAGMATTMANGSMVTYVLTDASLSLQSTDELIASAKLSFSQEFNGGDAIFSTGIAGVGETQENNLIDQWESFEGKEQSAPEWLKQFFI